MAIWKEIEKVIPVYKKTFEAVLDFNKYNMIAMSFHSTAIEGSILTLAESELLLDKVDAKREAVSSSEYGIRPSCCPGVHIRRSHKKNSRYGSLCPGNRCTGYEK